MRCTTCNSENGSKAKFCWQCGTAIGTAVAAVAKSGIRRCSKCKMVVPAGSQYCNQCGDSMTETMPPIPTKAKRGGSKRLVFASTLILGAALAFVYVHFAGGGTVAAPLQGATGEVPTTTSAAQGSKGQNTTWLIALRSDLRKCDAESIFAQPFCREKAKFRHCKNRWGTVAECPKASAEGEETL